MNRKGNLMKQITNEELGLMGWDKGACRKLPRMKIVVEIPVKLYEMMIKAPPLYDDVFERAIRIGKIIEGQNDGKDETT